MSIADSDSRRTHTLRRPLVVALITAVAATVAIGTGPASAASSGSVTETIHLGILSVTLSTGSVDMCSTSAPLTFPNGTCTSPPLTITNGTAPAAIDVQGANAYPASATADPGTSPPDWTLCDASSACTGPAGNFFTNPGQDQYSESTIPATGANASTIALTNSAQCDTAFATNSCAASPNEQSVGEAVFLRGPAASTDPSSAFISSVTWTAVAP